VTDSGNDRVCVFTTEGEFLFDFAVSGEPSDVAFDAEGNVYVSACDRRRVEKFTAQGESLNQSLKPISKPEGVCVDSAGNIYVVSKGSNQIYKFNPQHQLLKKWGGRGSESGKFNKPYGIAVDADDYIYVADCNNNRIQKFDSEGNFISQFTGSPQYPLQRPEDIAFDQKGNFYVAEVGTERIQKFSPDGELLARWSLEEFNALGCVAVDTQNYVYATCYFGNCVYKFAKRNENIEHNKKTPKINLGDCFPNPLNPECYISMQEKEKDVRIYNILGQLIRKIKCSTDQTLKETRVYWDGRNSQGEEVPSGVYFYEVGKREKIKKMVVLR
jgi:DNA-binding beta-propeller fold protein YncE